MKTFLPSIILFVFMLSTATAQDPILIDHTCRDLSDIPEAWIDSAKKKLFIAYGHTSHGSQLTTGMEALETYFTNGLYNWSHTGGTNELHLFEGAGYDDGYLELDCGRPGWDDETRKYLDDFPECNVMIWSWCGQVNEVDLQSHYLDPMAQLEAEYPHVTFVYMTGHLEGLGPDGSLFHANQQIRDYCQTNNKILYDFADIEKYNPDIDTNYQYYFADDACNYILNGNTRNWASSWINKNPDHLLTQISQQCERCAHSEHLNCVLKGIASWWLWARIAGWPGTDSTITTTFTSQTGLWNDPNNWDKGLPDSTKDAVIPSGTKVLVDTNVQCKELTIQPEATLTLNQADTLAASHVSIKSLSDTSLTGLIFNHGFMDIHSGIQIERLIRQNQWTPLSTGVDNATAQAYNPQDEELYSWSPLEAEFTAITDNSTSLDPFRGYLYRNQSADTLISQQGGINQGPQNRSLTVNESDSLYKGWNMLGNPYNGQLNWHNTGWDKSRIANSLYFYSHPNHQPAAYVNGFSNPAGYANNLIQPLEAFWVYAQEQGDMSVNHQALADMNAVEQVREPALLKTLRLQTNDNGSVYECLIILDSSATRSFDPQLDAFHMPAPLPGISEMPGMFSLDSLGERLAVNSLPEEDTFRVYLGYIFTSSGEHTIEAKEIHNMQRPIYLIDKATGETAEISSQSYTFTASAGSNDDRFILTTTPPSSLPAPIIVNHVSTVYSQIPAAWLDSAQNKLHIGYGHTAHGSQLITGMNTLEAFFSDGRFDWNTSPQAGSLTLFEGDGASQDGWLGLDASTNGWDQETREYLEAHPQCNTIIWAWGATEHTILDKNVTSDYLQPMNQLETEYPAVNFVYMTAPLAGLGEQGAVKIANDSIREYCKTHNKILYDFADIEKYSPDRDTNYQRYGSDDACNFDPDGTSPYTQTQNWAANWISRNPEDTLTLLTQATLSEHCSNAQTHCLNCVLKGIAAWHLWARIAGWNGNTTASRTSIFISDTGSWDNQENWDNGVPNATTHATLPNGSSLTTASHAHCKLLTIQPEGTFIINKGDTLSASELTLKSRMDTAITGLLFNHGHLNITGQTKVERFIPADTWMALSPPVTNATAEAFNAQAQELYQWDTSLGKFIKITDNTTTLNPMQGYLYKAKSADTLVTFKGAINQGQQDFNLAINETDTLYQGWNFIGNPYSYPIHWNDAIWNKSNVANSIYFYDPISEQPCSYVAGISNPKGCSDGSIAPMRAFWVFAHQEGKISVDHTNEDQTSKLDNSSYTSDLKSIRLQFSDSSTLYKSVIIFDHAAMPEFDMQRDALHMPVPLVEKSWSPGLYSIGSQKNKLSINTLPDDQDFRIPLGFSILNEGYHTFKVSEINNISDTLYLTDQDLNKQINITQSEYSFWQEPVQSNNRLILTTQLLTNNLSTTDFQKIKVYGYNKRIYIISEEQIQARIRIMDMLGRVIYDNHLVLNGRQTIPLEDSGNFIVVVEANHRRLACEMVIV